MKNDSIEELDLREKERVLANSTTKDQEVNVFQTGNNGKKKKKRSKLKKDSVEELDPSEKEENSTKLDPREKEANSTTIQRWDEPSCYVVSGSVVNASVVMKNESVEMLEPLGNQEKKKKKHLKRNICERRIGIVVDHNTLEQEERERFISEDEKVSIFDVFWKGKEKIHQPKNGRSLKLVLKRYIDMCLDSGEPSASVVSVVSGSDVSGFAESGSVVSGYVGGSIVSGSEMFEVDNDCQNIVSLLEIEELEPFDELSVE
ncbi:hypothetical protein Tco_0992212 [Tanacetum coccineum]|uniref:Uncharacterized protein n=1 Tax=Tanacetum coccineum TaxID=301880 RepID=A0ABQ5F258_9ASTR